MKELGQQATVLVVDDRREVADLYAERLAGTYTVKTANSANEALEAMGFDVDVVLLDRKMPNRSGDEVLADLRSQGTNCRIVFVTAMKPDLEVLSMNFDDYLTKPVSAEDLHSVVESMLLRNEYIRDIQEFLTLASKMSTLETKMDIAELDASEEYAKLQRRFQKLRKETRNPPDDILYSNLAHEKMEMLFDEQ